MSKKKPNVVMHDGGCLATGLSERSGTPSGEYAEYGCPCAGRRDVQPVVLCRRPVCPIPYEFRYRSLSAHPRGFVQSYRDAGLSQNDLTLLFRCGIQNRLDRKGPQLPAKGGLWV